MGKLIFIILLLVGIWYVATHVDFNKIKADTQNRIDRETSTQYHDSETGYQTKRYVTILDLFGNE